MSQQNDFFKSDNGCFLLCASVLKQLIRMYILLRKGLFAYFEVTDC